MELFQVYSRTEQIRTLFIVEIIPRSLSSNSPREVRPGYLLEITPLQKTVSSKSLPPSALGWPGEALLFLLPTRPDSPPCVTSLGEPYLKRKQVKAPARPQHVKTHDITSGRFTPARIQLSVSSNTFPKSQ